MKIFNTLLFVIICQICLAADINIKSQIKEVTVYTNSAQIKAVADANLTKGTYNLVFENVSPFIDENSIQIKGNTDFTILSIVVKKDFLNEGFKDATLKKLEDSLVLVTNKIATTQNNISALTDELNMIKANQRISGSNTNLSSLELEKMATFIRSRNEEIYNKITEQNNSKTKLQLKLNDLQNQINTYNAENNKNKADIVVAIKSNAISKTDLELVYNVQQAGWSPFYDIKAESISSPVVITSKANVWQNTGDNWNNVKLFISTGNPTVSMNIPDMNPFYVNVQNENYRPQNSLKKSRSKFDGVYSSDAEAAPMVQYSMPLVDANKTASAYTTNIESQTNNVFEISIPYTIKTDGAQNLVEIQKYEVPAKYSYIAKPKVECGAYLEAKLIDWNQSGLLPGDANIFFEGAYIGKTYFETNASSDTISISFGKDNNIVVERKRTKLLNDKNFIGGNKTVSFDYEIVVKNKKKSNIEILVEDQIPLSANTNTEVELDSNSKADYTKETGALKWTTTLKPAENITHKFGFKVRYPKGFKITNLN